MQCDISKLGTRRRLPHNTSRARSNCITFYCLYPDTPEEECAYKVLDLWTHCPTSWAAHIDMSVCPTAAELIKVATDKHKQLQASNITNLSKLVQAELQWQQQQRFANAQLANIEEENEEFELEGLIADAKPSANKNPIKAPGTFPYPPVNNRSRKTLPRPCCNCGSPYITTTTALRGENLAVGRKNQDQIIKQANFTINRT